jgi:replicative DNA helicase/ribosomal protein L37AE/L43A
MIPQEQCQAEELVVKMGWANKPAGEDHLAIESCPFCHRTDYKFFINLKNGMWDCKKCSEAGNFYQLKQKLGVSMDGAMSIREAGQVHDAPQPLPDVDFLHRKLTNPDSTNEAIDYLLHERGLTMAVIEQYKIGLDHFNGQDWIVYPYLDPAGKPIFVKYRSVPPADKAFRSSPGRAVPLFNGNVLKPGMDEVICVEGEIDALSLLSNGYESVVGVPGAAIKKTEWIATLDRVKPKNIYLLYDNDKVGQDCAHEMAVKIGIDKVRSIVLPEFEVPEGKKGKDINDWFRAGRTLPQLLELKEEAKQFNVQGVQSVVEVIVELRQEIEAHGTEPKYKTMWESLNKRCGGFEDGDLVGWSAEGKCGKSTMILNLLDWEAGINGNPSLFHCLEMTPKRLVRKWASYVTQTDDTPGASKFTLDTLKDALGIGAKMKADLLFGYQKVKRTEEVFELIYQAVRRYGVKVVGFDNLQLLIRSLEHAAQETSRAVKDFKSIAMELKILMHLIIQPNRVKEGDVVAARNAMGSSAIEKDVDSYICLHRNRVAQIKAKDFMGFMDVDDNFEPQMLTRVDLSRYAPGGTCTLYFDGARSTVREMTQGDVTSATYHPGVIEVEQRVEV